VLKAHLNSLYGRICNRLLRRRKKYVFVLGNQKSGTTAIAALLAECTAQSVALDLRELVKPGVTDQYINGALTLDRLADLCHRAWGKRIIKEPTLTFYFNELLQRYSTSTFVFMVRDPRDNIRSILQRLKLPGDQRDLTQQQWQNMSPAWREIVQNRKFGFDGGTYVESLARRWVRAWELAASARDRVVVVKYEDFLGDKVGTIYSLAAEAGLEPRHDIASRVDKQFQRKGDRSKSWIEFFGSANLTLINEICQEPMQRLGYEVNQLQAV